MALIGGVPVSMGGANGFPLLRGLKYYAWITIPSKPRLCSQVVVAMDLS